LQARVVQCRCVARRHRPQASGRGAQGDRSPLQCCDRRSYRVHPATAPKGTLGCVNDAYCCYCGLPRKVLLPGVMVDRVLRT
jgi:hypothetical protein